MDFDSILRFFNFSSSKDSNTPANQGADPILQDEYSASDLSFAEIQDFSENFKSFSMLDESGLQSPVNVNEENNGTFLYHNDDLTVIDLDKTADIQWNSFMQNEIDEFSPFAINTSKKSITLDPSEIVDSGNNITFLGDEFDDIHFTDDGWMQVEHLEAKTEEEPSLDVYIHVDTGAIVHVDTSILTHSPEG